MLFPYGRMMDVKLTWRFPFTSRTPSYPLIPFPYASLSPHLCPSYGKLLDLFAGRSWSPGIGAEIILWIQFGTVPVVVYSWLGLGLN